MTQLTFGDAEYVGKRKRTRREVFLAEMERVVPWAALVEVIEPFYPKAGNGRPPYPLETMLRIHLMQQWLGLSDEAMEEALYETAPLRQFAGLRLTGALPDESTILNFRHLLERHGLAPRILAAVNADLERRGLLLRQGTIVDATLVHAPSSTKNRQRQRDPEMGRTMVRTTKKGNQYFFGMKAHIGVDADSGLVHTVLGTAANVNDVTQAHGLLHGQETAVHGDAGDQGAERRPEASDRPITWYIAMKPGQRRRCRTPLGAS